MALAVVPSARWPNSCSVLRLEPIDARPTVVVVFGDSIRLSAICPRRRGPGRPDRSGFHAGLVVAIDSLHPGIEHACKLRKHACGARLTASVILVQTGRPRAFELWTAA